MAAWQRGSVAAWQRGSVAAWLTQWLRGRPAPQEERTSFSDLLLGASGLVDSFRRQHPEAVAYTYWTYKFNCRANNKGWRLDYFLVGGGLCGHVGMCPGVDVPQGS